MAKNYNKENEGYDVLSDNEDYQQNEEELMQPKKKEGEAKPQAKIPNSIYETELEFVRSDYEKMPRFSEKIMLNLIYHLSLHTLGKPTNSDKYIVYPKRKIKAIKLSGGIPTSR